MFVRAFLLCFFIFVNLKTEINLSSYHTSLI